MTDAILQRLDEIKGLLTANAAVAKVPSPKSRVRIQKCTQAAFELLPATVSRQEFMDWTGYDASELTDEVNAGRIAVYRPKGHTKARYYKHEIARLGGWKM
jgi:hypothetical protein